MNYEIFNKHFSSIFQDMHSFIQDIIRINSVTGNEETILHYIQQKLNALGFSDIRFDSWGNLTGSLGQMRSTLLFDSHVDTVEPGSGDGWINNDPLSGDIVDNAIYGRGSLDMKSALACSIYAAHIAEKAGLLKNQQVHISASIMEEDYEGLALEHLTGSLVEKPMGVVICEPSALKIARGQCALQNGTHH